MISAESRQCTLAAALLSCMAFVAGCGSPVSEDQVVHLRGTVAPGIREVLLVDRTDGENRAATVDEKGQYVFRMSGGELSGSWGIEKEFCLQVPAQAPGGKAWVNSCNFHLRSELVAPRLCIWDPAVSFQATEEGGAAGAV